jgi:hypothetical protein
MDRPGATREPRSMTMVDLVTLVAGVALGYAAIASQPGLAFMPPAWVLAVIAISNVFFWMAAASSFVALGRVTAYRRMPRPAEWLAILISVAGLTGRPEFNVDGWVNECFAVFPAWKDRLDFDGWRWLVAGLAGLASLATIGAVRLGRRAFPPWLKTLLLAWSALIAYAGPLWVFGFLGDDLVSPSRGFGVGDLAIFHRQACGLFGQFPTGVFFGIPAMGALLDRLVGRRWSWVEWSAAAATPKFIFAPLMLYPWEFATISPAWLAERALLLTWLVAIALTSRWISIRFGPPWRQWIVGPADQDRSDTESISEASTR